ncbi:DNA invertase Pin-like site-specific DNA recombinase [Parabacteroides sp. PF5-5]|uniref:recombinase family protein n=1 Tax=unclassified Parabacteroides TaxID=2649774 RepID=UPI0024737B1D|nr:MULTISPECIES: recombinase family protein [unclassified Parabacteroides]MDH6304354.1 DNA invertase Pin-like site-specific DNA recombinase [Parabacteroides sp. PH5-39]MDH6315493.1 DNA invertase Pin-like site-specific DNA recombinase [Parabacteroides sp. PF5-13]MDH6319013.1 DNA invertase Pin-like site-specific DNA recombinase [Parabacteroides sp. PH5-13]MDH6322742.1 DNA invertase Pin-like site-specific DNA recombinase [Parabacteroides sp. PH5-8]MDH6326686.1 DNA invertase Pin-like site-specific
MAKDAVIYLRVSTEEQDYNRQLEDLRSFAKKENYAIIKTFSDKMSGLKDERYREGLSEMKEYLIQNDIKTVLVWEISRLGRKQSTLNLLIEFFEEHKINVYFYSQNIWLLDNGKISFSAGLMLNVIGYYAGYELKLMKDRMISAKKINVSLGKVVSGTTRFGYKADENKMIVPDTDIIPELGKSKADIVLELFKTYETGVSTNELRRICMAKGYPKHLLVNSNIVRILRNEDYKGGRQVKLGFRPVPKLVEPWLWDKCAELRKQNNTKIDKSYKYVNLLKDVLICSVCGSKCTTLIRKGYICTKNIHTQKQCYGTSCECLAFSERALNGIIWTYSQPFISDLKNKEAQEAQEQQTNAKIKAIELEIEQYAKVFSILNKELDKTKVMFKADTIDKDEFLREAKRINTDKDQNQKKIDKLNSEIALLKRQINQKIKIKELLSSYKEIIDIHQIKTLINAVIEEVKIYTITRFDKIVRVQRKDGVIDYLYYYSQLKKEFYFHINQSVIFFDKEKKQLYFKNTVSTKLLYLLYGITIKDNIVPLDLIRDTAKTNNSLGISSVVTVVPYNRLDVRNMNKTTNLTKFKHQYILKTENSSKLGVVALLPYKLKSMIETVFTQITKQYPDIQANTLYNFIEKTFGNEKRLTECDPEELEVILKKTIMFAKKELCITIPELDNISEEDKEPSEPYEGAYYTQWISWAETCNQK